MQRCPAATSPVTSSSRAVGGIGHDRGDALFQPVHGHQGLASGERFQEAGRGARRGQDKAVHLFRKPQQALLLGVVLCLQDRDCRLKVTEFRRALGALDDGGEEAVLQCGDDNRHQARGAFGEGAGGPVGGEAQAGGGIDHALTCLRAQQLGLVHGA
jgi:hypothetical protein